MSEPIDAGPSEDQIATSAPLGETEEIDGLPVLAERDTVIQARRLAGAVGQRGSSAAMIPVVQAAAVAAGGFVARAAVVGLVHRRPRRFRALSQGSLRG